MKYAQRQTVTRNVVSASLLSICKAPPHSPILYNNRFKLIHAWGATPTQGDHFWRLPSEHNLRAIMMSTWFCGLLTIRPMLSPISHRHHDLRVGRAKAHFVLEALEAHIREWVDWAHHSRAFWRYIDIEYQPTELDSRLFG